MKRFALVLALASLLVAPGAALGFHHRDLPARTCSAEAAGDPSNSNGGANATIGEHNPNGLPLPPLGEPGRSGMTTGTPGNDQGQGGAHCANG